MNTTRTAKQRNAKFSANLDPTAIYLSVKKQMHTQDMIIGVQTLKDMAIAPIMAGYELDARGRTLALIAWRELYFMAYKRKQKVVKVE